MAVASAAPVLEAMSTMGERKGADDRRGMLIGGVITLGIGVVFLLVNFDIIPNVGKMWPIFPIIVGIALIVGAFVKRRGGPDAP